MTRSTDPYAHTELRGLVSPHTHPSSSSSSSGTSPTIYPTYVLPASMTTIHPQLRDLLVCPGRRGELYYVQGRGITRMTVDLEGEGEFAEAVRQGKAVVGEWNPKRTYSTFSNLLFTPNCLTTSSTLLACGGQNGELHLTTLPALSSSSSWSSSSRPTPPSTLDRPIPRTPQRQRNRDSQRSSRTGSDPGSGSSGQAEGSWSMTMTLPNTSINNSFLLLPAYKGHSPLPTRPSSPSNNHPHQATGSGSAVGGRRRTGNSTSNGLGIATYPNSVEVEGDDGGARYATVGSGSGARFGTFARRGGGSMGRNVGSRARVEDHDEEEEDDDDDDDDDEQQHEETGDGWTTVGPSTTRGHRDPSDEVEGMDHDWEGFDTIFPPAATNRSGFSPRVSSGTRTVTYESVAGTRTVETTFSGPSTARPGAALWQEATSVLAGRASGTTTRMGSRRRAWMPASPDNRSPWHAEDPHGLAAAEGTAWEDPTGTGNWTGGRNRPTRARPFRSTIEYESTFSPIREDEPRLLVSNNDMSVKLFAIRNAKSTQASPPLRWGEIQNKGPRKKLANIGGTKFDTAVNHASISPDGTTMLVVGDTNDVFLYEVRGGGREFSKIARYEGSRDAGFSTSWSADGRKFVVASQDGQVTVWDHRSSHPLAKLYTSRASSRSTSYGVDSLYWGGPSEPDSPTPYVSPTTLTSSGRSAWPGSPGRGSPGRRDPARVVKFSPAGSGRELLVFSEETDHIHIADARTFDAQITVRVPLKATFGQTIWNEDPSHVRTAADRGRVGIAGLCFDEKGDFLYAGTESSIVEYDLRLESKRGSGYISMI